MLNSLEAAVDLLEKKSAIYSDRPYQPMAGEFMHWSQQLVLSPYGEHFRNMCKLLHRSLGGRGQHEKILPYHDLIEREIRRFLARLHEDPDAEHLKENIRK